MKEIKNFYTGLFLIAVIVICSVLLGFDIKNNNTVIADNEGAVINTNYGSFLAAQHALYVNDFEAANKMIASVDVDAQIVGQTKILSDFLAGKMPKSAESLSKDKSLSNRLIYDAYLLNKDDWKSLYKRYNVKDNAAFLAPLKIFSSLKQGKKKEALKFIDSLRVSAASKAFLRGQVAVLENDIDTAAKEFAKVDVDFMNINDYLYLMSFYRENEMFEDMDILRNDFVSNAGGFYVLYYPDIPEWSVYSGYKNNLAFSMLQTVSHTQFLMYTDISLILLRFAQIISDNTNADAINYYLGNYLFFNNGKYVPVFEKISDKSPFYLFGQMKIAESTKDIGAIKKIANKNPLFVPAVLVSIEDNIKNGDKKAALRIVNRALGQENLPDTARVFFLKQRAKIYLAFDDAKKAQSDIDEVLNIDDSLSVDMLLLQSCAWIKQNTNLEDAYKYAMVVIKKDTSNVIAWDLLGLAVEKKEGVYAALDLIERVGEVSVSVSSLFEHLGDYYKKVGNNQKAKESYQRAIDLSDDGLVVVPNIKKKMKVLK